MYLCVRVHVRVCALYASVRVWVCVCISEKIQAKMLIRGNHWIGSDF